MKRKIIKLLVFLLIVVLFTTVTTIKVEAVNTTNNNHYSLYINNEDEAKNLIEYLTGKMTVPDYHGYCGQYVHDMLASANIIESYSSAYDGKDWFNAFLNKNEGNKLVSGWTYECYKGSDSLKKILEKYNGKVYNILFSMESGSPFGHTFFVNAIINDRVYYSESFGSSYFGANQKEFISMSLEKFINYYMSGGYFNISSGGIVHFYEENFYRPIISFDGQKTVSSEYVYNYVLNEEKSEFIYDDIKNANNKLTKHNYLTEKKVIRYKYLMHTRFAEILSVFQNIS